MAQLTKMEHRLVVDEKAFGNLFGGFILPPSAMPDDPSVEYITIDPDGKMTCNPTVIRAANRSTGYPGDKVAFRKPYLARKLQFVVPLAVIKPGDMIHEIAGRKCLHIRGRGWDPATYAAGATLVADVETIPQMKTCNQDLLHFGDVTPDEVPDCWFLEGGPIWYGAGYAPQTRMQIPHFRIPYAEGQGFLFIEASKQTVFAKMDPVTQEPGAMQLCFQLPAGVRVETLEGPYESTEDSLLVHVKASSPNERKRVADHYLWFAEVTRSGKVEVLPAPEYIHLYPSFVDLRLGDLLKRAA